MKKKIVDSCLIIVLMILLIIMAVLLYIKNNKNSNSNSGNNMEYVENINVAHINATNITNTTKTDNEGNLEEQLGKIHITVSSMAVPPTRYTFEMNESGIATINTYHSSSTLDSNGSEYNYDINFTREELKNIETIFNKIKETSNVKSVDGYWFYYDVNGGNDEISIAEDNYMNLISCMSAIESIGKNDKVMTDSSNPLYEEYDKVYDLNGDGTVTCREFGDAYLKDIINEM